MLKLGQGACLRLLPKLSRVLGRARYMGRLVAGAWLRRKIRAVRF